ncbi:MAG: hypothetical protein HZA46_00285 [Planctomycetales bacterium]|nr:hypothetical protein [Planctomycetales bacterium]
MLERSRGKKPKYNHTMKTYQNIRLKVQASGLDHLRMELKHRLSRGELIGSRQTGQNRYVSAICMPHKGHGIMWYAIGMVAAMFSHGRRSPPYRW